MACLYNSCDVHKGEADCPSAQHPQRQCFPQYTFPQNVFLPLFYDSVAAAAMFDEKRIGKNMEGSRSSCVLIEAIFLQFPEMRLKLTHSRASREHMSGSLFAAPSCRRSQVMMVWARIEGTGVIVVEKQNLEFELRILISPCLSDRL
jgi:hypothetical protein